MSGTNSTGATLARLAAEFVVIVVGVLVALFAESAWQERMEPGSRNWRRASSS